MHGVTHYRAAVDAHLSSRQLTQEEWTQRESRRDSVRLAEMMAPAGGHTTLGGESGYGRGKKTSRMEGTMDAKVAALSSFGTSYHNVTDDGLPRYASTMQKSYGFVGVPVTSRDDGSGATARALDAAHPDSGGVWLGTRWSKPASKRGHIKKPFPGPDMNDPRIKKWHGAAPPRKSAAEIEMLGNTARSRPSLAPAAAPAPESAEIAELRGMGIGTPRADRYKAALSQWISTPTPVPTPPPMPTPPKEPTPLPTPVQTPPRPKSAPPQPVDDLTWVTRSMYLGAKAPGGFARARDKLKDRPNPVPSLALSEMATQHLNPHSKIKMNARKSCPIIASG